MIWIADLKDTMLEMNLLMRMRDYAKNELCKFSVWIQKSGVSTYNPFLVWPLILDNL